MPGSAQETGTLLNPMLESIDETNEYQTKLTEEKTAAAS